MNIKEITERNYESTIKRGLINENTTFKNFISKLNEEVNELDMSELPFNSHSIGEFDERELADIILVCLAMAKHYKIDVMKVLEEKTLYNEKRSD